MAFKILQKLKSYLLYGVAFSLIVGVSSFVSGLFGSKNSPTVSKGVQLPSIFPFANADVPADTPADTPPPADTPSPDPVDGGGAGGACDDVQ